MSPRALYTLAGGLLILAAAYFLAPAPDVDVIRVLPREASLVQVIR